MRGSISGCVSEAASALEEMKQELMGGGGGDGDAAGAAAGSVGGGAGVMSAAFKELLKKVDVLPLSLPSHPMPYCFLNPCFPHPDS